MVGRAISSNGVAFSLLRPGILGVPVIGNNGSHSDRRVYGSDFQAPGSVRDSRGSGLEHHHARQASFTAVSLRTLAASVASAAAGFVSVVLESRNRPPTGLSGSARCCFLSNTPLTLQAGVLRLLGSSVAAAVAAAEAAALGFFKLPSPVCPAMEILLGSFTVVSSRSLAASVASAAAGFLSMC
mmetsp:Transcript_24235/g.43347  ORF Transcript_24235/g.43347 Transcript_24235/m.43347 type:complete len:184 (-) Transcript_24235:1128-1679(-)